MFSLNDFTQGDIIKIDNGSLCLVLGLSETSNNLIVAKIYDEIPPNLPTDQYAYDISHVFKTKKILILNKYYTADVSRVIYKLCSLDRYETVQMLTFVSTTIAK